MNKQLRRLKHIFKSGCLFRGIEHFLVMFPSALIIVSVTPTVHGEQVFSLSSILFAVGIGTILFIMLTKGKIPFFLGPSFSYIGFTSYYISTISQNQDIQFIRSTIFSGYLISAIMLAFLSLLYRKQITKKILDFLFPSVVMGPAISLIGLELVNSAISDSGLNGSDFQVKILSIVTLAIIIVAALTKRRFFKNTSVFIGILCGCAIAFFMGIFKVDPSYDGKMFVFPRLFRPNFFMRLPAALNLMVLILPSTIMNFTELMGRVKVLEGMQKRDNVSTPDLMSKSIECFSLSNMFIGILSSVPVTFYAENLAIMNLNSVSSSASGNIRQDDDPFVQNCYQPYSFYPYIIAALLSILAACSGWLQNLFMAIPKAVLGAMELFVFTLVASPGIQMLVESKVDYKKNSNQIISASILLAGVSSLVIEYKTIYLKGMGLGLTIGVILNIIVKVFSYLGILNEQLTLKDILNISLDCLSEKVTLYPSGNPPFSGQELTYRSGKMKTKIQEDTLLRILQMSDKIELTGTNTNRKIIIEQIYDRITITVRLPIEQQKEYTNDHDFIVPMDASGLTKVIINASVSARKLHDILKQIEKEKSQP